MAVRKAVSPSRSVGMRPHRPLSWRDWLALVVALVAFARRLALAHVTLARDASTLHGCHAPVPSLRARGTDVSPQPRRLRRAGYQPFGRDQYVVSWCEHGQEFITVPDRSGMWWLVPIVGEAS